MRLRPLVFSFAIAGAACTPASAPTAPATTPPTDDGPRAWDVRIYDATAGKEVTLGQMLDVLATEQYVLVGETHLDAETHRLENEIFAGLLERLPGKVSLSLEMFERDVQPVLDEYLAGKRDEKAFLADARPWGNYRTGYRPLVETARSAKAPVVAANLPQSLRMKFGMQGKKALDELTPEEKGWLPAKILPAPAGYWERLGRQLRDHGHGMMPSTDEARLYSIQNLWDNAMADAAIAGRPDGGVVVHVAGAFHVEYGHGVGAQIRGRVPDAEIKTVTVVAVDELSTLEPAEDADRADYVVYVVGHARGRNDGMYGVAVTSELRYLLSATPEDDTPRPLLVWFCEDGVRLADELDYWERALGDGVMVAVVEPRNRETQDDLRVAGRWAWPDTYVGDLMHVVGGTGRILEYVRERFPIDDHRIVLAGAGAGGSVALWAGLYAGDDVEDGKPTIVAASPTEVTRFAEASVPRDPPALSTVVVVADDDAQAGPTETYAAAGYTGVRGAPAGATPEETWRTLETEIRTAMKLDAATPPTGEAAAVKIPVDTPLARQWGRLYARARPDARVAVEYGPRAKGSPIPLPAESFAEGKHLPLAPGPFGGTTVLVLPSSMRGADRKAWQALGETDALNERSRFAHLAVTDDKGLPATLADIHAKNRRNVLIVPAEFVASPERMTALRGHIEGHDPSLSIAWQPGLGAALVESMTASGAQAAD